MNLTINKVKIFVTVPEENVMEVRNAVCEAGAGLIGNYSYCTFAVCGEGTFVPNEEANPHIGTKNNLEFVKELKIEFVCGVEKVKEVLDKIRSVHPYEEPAIDIVPLLDESLF